jgi:hypothetical protein
LPKLRRHELAWAAAKNSDGLVYSGLWHRANTVTESVVLPPFIGGVHHAAIKAAGPINPALVSGVVDWRNRKYFGHFQSGVFGRSPLAYPAVIR